jgi:hypothetical protein
MPEYTEIVDRATSSVVDAIKSAQEPALSAVATVSKAVADFVPDLPAVPFADQLPTPESVVERSFAFAAELLELQKRFVLEVLDALGPVRDKVRGHTNGQS